MKKIGVPLEGFAEAAREAGKEGAVLLKNEQNMLPIGTGEKVSVFGRCQSDYYRSGTGSGGLVNVAYTTNLLQALREKSTVVNEELAQVYDRWIAENPFDNGGGGWRMEPWNQAEMPLNPELVKAARAVFDKAIIVIGRTAGEDKDNADLPGSIRLTPDEQDMIAQVTACFEKTAVILNVSNIIDMSFLCTEAAANIKAVLYTWHGGIEGGNAAADLLLGHAVPSGKLPDTIAYTMQDYPSTANFGDPESNSYVEDIYVGYRYFETFCPEKVMFEFGYGLSYTDFSITCRSAELIDDKTIKITAAVQNTGNQYVGKEVVQVYYEAPQGKLGQPSRQLAAYGKTELLAPGAVQEMQLFIPVEEMKTYDDSGITGAHSAYVMEAGDYHIYLGSSVRKTQKVYTYHVDALRVVCQLAEALAPVKEFQRLKPGARKADGIYEVGYEPVPLRKVSLRDRIQERLPETLPQTGNKGIRLADVKQGAASLEDFIAQLTDAELAMIARGEGMGHPEVTAGTASAFGSVGESLIGYGIPLACTADGPSGIRMGPGLLATQVPIGTLLAASFNDRLIEELYVLEGQELHRNEVDFLLGPGMNIHRNPMNGRNFEYFSEDPLLTGNMAAACIKGIEKGGAHATAKHFACNSQETARTKADSVISERAAREIYLKGFEKAVKKGNVKAVMTAYNPVNGHWTASNYDLNTTILRKEWGYEGIVMTDWWAQMNNVEEGGPASLRNMRDMVRAGNDLYMVVNNYGAEANSSEDDILASLQAGTLTTGELQRNAMNICRVLMETQAMGRKREAATATLEIAPLCPGNDSAAAEMIVVAGESSAVPVTMSENIEFQVSEAGLYNVLVHMISPDFNTAQISYELYVNDQRAITIAIRGTDGKWITQKIGRMKLQPGGYRIRVEEVKPRLQVDLIKLEKVGV